MPTELKLAGVDELLEDLLRLAPDLAAEAATLERTIGEQTAAAIRAGYPIVTGQLRRSVQVQRGTSSSPARVFTEISVTAPYAEAVEFGTSRTVPRPNFVPASRRGREAFVRAVIARVRAEGLKVAGGL